MMIGFRHLALAGALALGACAHTPEEKMRADYTDTADHRIDQMEDNVKNLQKRADQLLGDPRAQLLTRIDTLKGKIEDAKAQMKEMKGREGSSWVEKKSEVDKSLAAMDDSYAQALQVLAH